MTTAPYTLTLLQARAFVDALEADTLASAKPCPDLLAWIAECRADESLLRWEADRWDSYDGDSWEAATLIEYSNGQMAVVTHADGPRGVVMLPDDRFHVAEGNPSADWSLAMGDDHPGFATLAEAVAATKGV